MDVNMFVRQKIGHDCERGVEKDLFAFYLSDLGIKYTEMAHADHETCTTGQDVVKCSDGRAVVGSGVHGILVLRHTFSDKYNAFSTRES